MKSFFPRYKHKFNARMQFCESYYATNFINSPVIKERYMIISIYHTLPYIICLISQRACVIYKNSTKDIVLCGLILTQVI